MDTLNSHEFSYTHLLITHPSQSRRRTGEVNVFISSRKEKNQKELRIQRLEMVGDSKGKRQGPGGLRRPQAATGNRYPGREMPSRLIFTAS